MRRRVVRADGLGYTRDCRRNLVRLPDTPDLQRLSSFSTAGSGDSLLMIFAFGTLEA
jgi:hypothetical protein